MLPLLGLVSTTLLAGTSGTETMAWGKMIIEMLAGLAIFLYAMDLTSNSLKLAAGDRLKIVLARLTTNRFMGAITGAFVTAVIQSSSVTTVLVVGFISAGLMGFSQSIGVIMGANIGTTITAQIVAFKVTKAALLMIAVGFFTSFLSKRETLKNYGGMLLGLGLVFFGMNMMSDAMKPLREYQPFLDLMVNMENPFLGIGVSALFTGLIQSSSATTGIVIVLASQGFISLEAGILLAFGANIGTCVTAVLASVGKSREAVRASVVHILFNFLGVAVWVTQVSHLADWVVAFSPAADPALVGMDRLAAEVPRQIANAHTLFNVANTILFIGFVPWFARFVEWLVPDAPLESEELVKIRYLDDTLLDTPTLALDRVRRELQYMGEIALEMLERVLPAFLGVHASEVPQLRRMDDKIDAMHAEVVRYLGAVSQRSLTQTHTDELVDLLAAVNDIENIGDLMETDMTSLVMKAKDERVHVSPGTAEVISAIHERVTNAVQLAIQAVSSEDQAAALSVVSMKQEINDLIASAALHQSDRLVAPEPNRLTTYAIEMDFIEKLKRVYYFAKRIAKPLAESQAKPV